MVRAYPQTIEDILVLKRGDRVILGDHWLNFPLEKGTIIDVDENISNILYNVEWDNPKKFGQMNDMDPYWHYTHLHPIPTQLEIFNVTRR